MSHDGNIQVLASDVNSKMLQYDFVLASGFVIANVIGCGRFISKSSSRIFSGRIILFPLFTWGLSTKIGEYAFNALINGFFSGFYNVLDII